MPDTSLQRYFSDVPLSAEPVDGEPPVVTLTGPEAHHLSRVMRAQVGDQLELFDGSGSQFVAELTVVEKSQVQLRVLSEEKHNRELPHALTLAVALPKGDRQKWLVEKLVELGASRLIPLVSKRSVVQPNEKAVERLRRGVIEATKQCRRNRLMEIADVQTWEHLVKDESLATQRFVAHPYPTQLEPVALPSIERTATVVAIGPEGGLTEDEIKFAGDQRWKSITLGPRILRVETAAIAFAAAIGTQWI